MKNKLTVVTGNVDAQTKLKFAEDLVQPKIKEFLDMNSSNGTGYLLVNTPRGMTIGETLDALDCLDDHVENTELSDWTNKLELYNSVCDYGTYFGPSVDVTVYYLTDLTKN